MALSKSTKDHEEIKRWAEARGAVPSEVSSTHTDGEAGILRFQFPNTKQKNDAALREISWEEFFEKFDENDLELIYQEKTAAGQKSNFNKLIHPENEKASSTKKSSGSSTKSRTSATGKRSSSASATKKRKSA
jgi:hypothetical protein